MMNIVDEAASHPSPSEKELFALCSRGEIPEDKIDEFYRNDHKKEILRIIVSRRNFEVVKKLAENPQKFVEIFDLNFYIELINFVAEKEFFEIYRELKKIESEYEKALKIKVEFKYKKVLEDISKFHADISEGKTEEIKKFIESYSKLKLCYGSSDDSALEKSLNGSNFETFAILLTEGFDCNENCQPKILKKIEEKLEEILKSTWLKKILEACIKRRKIKILKKLTENVEKFMENIDLNLWTDLINFSADEENFEAYQELKKLEATYEIKLNQKNPEKDAKVDFQYKKVLDDISMLHAHISEGKIDEIQNFILKYPKLKLCYGLSDFCALERSIDARQFHTYAFLRAQCFYSDKGQQLQSKIQNFLPFEKEQIRLEILKYTVSDPIGLILTKCDLDACSDVLSFRDVREMLEILIEIKEIKPTLDILALSDVKIIFDYNSESVVAMNPTADELTLGLAYFKEGILYVGRNSSRAQRFGTFAHEATHFALFLLYENSCLPYRAEDDERERVWVEIVENIRKVYEANEEGTDNIIKWVYQLYDEGYQQNAELIVRVNDLLAFYHDNPQCQEVREIYRELFDFYVSRVMPDLSVKNALKVIKLNNNFELFKEIEDSNFQIKDCEIFHLLEFEENVERELNQKLQNFKNFLLISDVPRLTLSKLFKEISKKSSRKIDVKLKNIFINFERLQQGNLRKELEEVLKSFEILRIVIHFDDDDECQKFEESLKFLSNLKLSTQIFFVTSSKKVFKVLNQIFTIESSKIEIEDGKFEISPQTFENFQSSSLKFLKINLKHSWSDLTENSKTEVLKMKIKFRNQIFLFSKLFSPQNAEKLSAETLRILSSKNFCGIKLQDPVEIKFYVERRFLRSKQEERYLFDPGLIVPGLNLSKLMEKTKNDKIVIISNFAGSGKSTLLHKLHQTFNEKFKNFWICFVSLLRHKKVLLDRNEIEENFLKFVTHKILKLNELERKIFELKYEKDEVVILFDGFDEISPDCKRNAMKIFKSHKENGKSQIWITSRTHLEIDLEEELKIEAHKMASLSQSEQIEFLCEFWREACESLELRKMCAEMLVERVFVMGWSRWGQETLIGLTLQLRLLGEYFKEILSEEFDKEIKNLSFSQVYEFLIERSVNIKDENSVHDILKLHTDIYEVLALRNFLIDDERFQHLFGRASYVEDLTEEKLEELARGGIISYEMDKVVHFLHRTLLEFFVWRFAFNRIKNFKQNWKYENDFCKFFLILSRSDVTRLDECFKELSKNLEKSENLKTFAQTFYKFVIEQEKSSKTFEISHSTIFILKCFKFASVEYFKELIEQSDEIFSFCKFLENVKDPEICGELLDEVFRIFPSNSELFDFLMRKNEKDETIFHKIVDEDQFKVEIFSKFWAKIEEQNFEYEKVLNFFFAKCKFGRNFLAKTINRRNLIQGEKFCERIDAVIKVVKRILKVEDQRKLLIEVDLSDNECKCEKAFGKFFEFLREFFSPDETLELLTPVDENGQTILHKKKWNYYSVIIKFIFDELQKVDEKILKNFLLKQNKKGQNALMASFEQNSKNFSYTFDEIFLRFLALKDFIYEVDSEGWNILHYLTSFGDFYEEFKHFVRKAQAKLSSDEFKSFCKLKTKKSQNIFHLIAMRNFYADDESFVIRNIQFLAYQFPKDEMREILSEIDELGRIPLHYAATHEMIFRIIFDLYEKNFTFKENLKFFDLKDKKGKKVEEVDKNCKIVKEVKKKVKEGKKMNTFFDQEV